VGHHVQKLTGTFHKMEAARGRASEGEDNRTSVRMELQSDCYAGVWAHYAGTMNQLDSGDIAEALNAATAIGDDRLQKRPQGAAAQELGPMDWAPTCTHCGVRIVDHGLEKNGRMFCCDHCTE
jgi:predicted metalloprotease